MSYVLGAPIPVLVLTFWSEKACRGPEVTVQLQCSIVPITLCGELSTSTISGVCPPKTSVVGQDNTINPIFLGGMFHKTIPTSLYNLFVPHLESSATFQVRIYIC